MTSAHSRRASNGAPSLWREPKFLKLWTGETISFFGSGITTIAVSPSTPGGRPQPSQPAERREITVKTIEMTATGRRTGQPRTVTLLAFEDADRLVVVGSKGGSDSDPAWAGNLRAEPRVEVASARRRQQMLALEVSGEDRARLWELVSDAFPLYRTYQRQTKRLFPLFVLEPTVEDQPSA